MAAFFESLTASVAKTRTEGDVLRDSGQAEIVLDGSTYEAWFYQGTTLIHWRSMHLEINDTDAEGYTPIVKWMNSIRIYALTHATPVPLQHSR
jgi:hypothetical protein